MASKKYQFPVTVGIADRSLDIPPTLDANGRTIQRGSIGVRYAQPGEWVEVEEAEAEMLFGRFGHYDPTPKARPRPSSKPEAQR